MYFMLAYISFLIGFVFFTLHESNLFRGSFSGFGTWFSVYDPVYMKKKFPLFPFIWNFYHFSGWFMIFMFFNSMFFATVSLFEKPFVGYWVIGGSLAFFALLINAVLYGIYGKEKK